MHVELFQYVNIPGFLEHTGIYQFILPFLLALAIIYGALSYALGGKIQKSAIGLISLVLSFFVMLYSSWNLMIVNFFATLSGSALLVATGILVIVIFLGLFGVKPQKFIEKEGGGITKAGWFFIFTLVYIGIVLFLGTGWVSLLPAAYLTPDFQAAVIIIIIVALAMWWMTEGKEEEEK